MNERRHEKKSSDKRRSIRVLVPTNERVRISHGGTNIHTDRQTDREEEKRP